MDAKKASKVLTPRHLKDTKANFALNVIAIGGVVFSIACTYIAVQWSRSHPNRWIKKNKLTEYLASDEYKVNKAIWLGLSPQPYHLQEKYFRPIDTVTKNNPDL